MQSKMLVIIDTAGVPKINFLKYAQAWTEKEMLSVARVIDLKPTESIYLVDFDQSSQEFTSYIMQNSQKIR
jgi:hypothetical protein